jgi:hypothetical protein
MEKGVGGKIVNVRTFKKCFVGYEHHPLQVLYKHRESNVHTNTRSQGVMHCEAKMK